LAVSQASPDRGGPRRRLRDPPGDVARRDPRGRPRWWSLSAPADPGRSLVVALGVLLVIDLIGGLLAVGSGVNTWSEAWGGQALLAAPLPMIALQVVLGALGVRLHGRGGAVAAGLLALACAVSVVSGFFDGGLGNDELTPALS